MDAREVIVVDGNQMRLGVNHGTDSHSVEVASREGNHMGIALSDTYAGEGATERIEDMKGKGLKGWVF